MHEQGGYADWWPHPKPSNHRIEPDSLADKPGLTERMHVINVVLDGGFGFTRAEVERELERQLEGLLPRGRLGSIIDRERKLVLGDA